jgi:hypothetical protein
MVCHPHIAVGLDKPLWQSLSRERFQDLTVLAVHPTHAVSGGVCHPWVTRDERQIAGVGPAFKRNGVGNGVAREVDSTEGLIDRVQHPRIVADRHPAEPVADLDPRQDGQLAQNRARCRVQLVDAARFVWLICGFRNTRPSVVRARGGRADDHQRGH